MPTDEISRKGVRFRVAHSLFVCTKKKTLADTKVKVFSGVLQLLQNPALGGNFIPNVYNKTVSIKRGCSINTDKYFLLSTES